MNVFKIIDDTNLDINVWRNFLFLSIANSVNMNCLVDCISWTNCSMLVMEANKSCSFYNSSIKQSQITSLIDSPGSKIYHKGSFIIG